MAEVLQIPEAVVAEKTTATSRKFFRLPTDVLAPTCAATKQGAWGGGASAPKLKLGTPESTSGSANAADVATRRTGRQEGRPFRVLSKKCVVKEAESSASKRIGALPPGESLVVLAFPISISLLHSMVVTFG